MSWKALAVLLVPLLGAAIVWTIKAPSWWELLLLIWPAAWAVMWLAGDGDVAPSHRGKGYF